MTQTLQQKHSEYDSNVTTETFNDEYDTTARPDLKEMKKNALSDSELLHVDLHRLCALPPGFGVHVPTAEWVYQRRLEALEMVFVSYTLLTLVLVLLLNALSVRSLCRMVRKVAPKVAITETNSVLSALSGGRRQGGGGGGRGGGGGGGCGGGGGGGGGSDISATRGSCNGDKQVAAIRNGSPRRSQHDDVSRTERSDSSDVTSHENRDRDVDVTAHSNGHTRTGSQPPPLGNGHPQPTISSAHDVTTLAMTRKLLALCGVYIVCFCPMLVSVYALTLRKT
jgi:hypothetical protein